MENDPPVLYVGMIGHQYISNVEKNGLDGFTFDLVKEYNEAKHIPAEIKPDLEKYLIEADYQDIWFEVTKRKSHVVQEEENTAETN